MPPIAFITQIIEIIAGLGLIFFGRAIFTSNVRSVVGPKVNKILHASTRTRIRSMFCGVLVAIVFSKPSIPILIVASMVSAGIFTVKRVYPFLVWNNVGTVAILFVISLNIQLMAYLAVGVAGIWYAFTNNYTAKKALSLVISAALVFIGINLLKADLTQIQLGDSIERSLRYLADYPILYIPLTLVVRAFIQATLPLAIVAMGLYARGDMGADGIVYINVGFLLAKMLSFLFMSSNLKGLGKQFATMQQVYLSSLCLCFLTLNFIENFTGIPLIKSLVQSTIENPFTQFATIVLCFHLVTALILTILEKPILNFLAKKYPPDEYEGKDEPKYLYAYSEGAPDIALDLVEKEHLRMLTREASFITLLKQFKPDDEKLIKKMEAEHATFEVLGIKIQKFIQKIKSSKDLPPDTLSHFHSTLELHSTIIRLQELYYEIFLAMQQNKSPSKAITHFYMIICESLEFFTLELLDCMHQKSVEEATMIVDMSKDKLPVIEEISSRRFGDEALSDEEWSQAVNLTITASKAAWTVRQVATTLRFRYYEEKVGS